VIPVPRRPPRRALFLLPFAAAWIGASDAPPAPSFDPAECLAEVRHVLREEGLASPRAAALAVPLERAGDLWFLRLKVARAAVALAGGGASTAEPAPALDTAPLGLPGFGAWLKLQASSPSVSDLLTWAAAEPYEPFARDAVTLAARLARTTTEKAAARAALASWEARGAPTARAVIDIALARARVAPNAGEARRLRLALAALRPDAPERDADLFDAVDLKEFNAAVRGGPGEVRTARALTLARRAPKEALALLPRTPIGPAGRLDAAEVRFLTGDTAGALRLLRTPGPSVFADEQDARRARALELDAEMRLLLRGQDGATSARRARRRRAKVVTTLPGPPRLFREETRVRAAGLLTRVGELLVQPLSDTDRRRLTADAARISLRMGRADDARRLVGQIVLLDPTSGVIAEELFREAFEAYRQGRFVEAAASFEGQASLYREPAIRRRTTYWAGRAREKNGQPAAARVLYASLIAGTSADLYAVWAAAALGLPPPPGPPAPGTISDDAVPDRTAIGPPSRELLACGFPDLADDAAEAEGVTDPLFLAALASERGDHRRAAILLKQRWPELGSPEEGATPLAARRAYYPITHGALVDEAAAKASLPSALVFGLIRQESVFTTDLRSRAGAVGLMQLMPATGRQLHRRENHGGRPDLSNPAVNIRLGVAYLRKMLDAFGGEPVLALAAYNAGPARARRWQKDLGALPIDEFVESLPAAETRHYVKRVLFFEGAYAALYGLPGGVGLASLAPREAGSR
jgi:soluble lytic murein transglycosylase-like protein